MKYVFLNLEIFTDIPRNEFYEMLNNATVCCIPLKSKAPCGLYVMQHTLIVVEPVCDSIIIMLMNFQKKCSAFSKYVIESYETIKNLLC